MHDPDIHLSWSGLVMFAPASGAVGRLCEEAFTADPGFDYAPPQGRASLKMHRALYHCIVDEKCSRDGSFTYHHVMFIGT